MLEDGYLNSAFIPVLLVWFWGALGGGAWVWGLLLLLLLLLLFACGFKLAPGVGGEALPERGPGKTARTQALPGGANPGCKPRPSRGLLWTMPPPQKSSPGPPPPPSNPQAAGSSAYLRDFQPWSTLYLSTSEHRSWLTDSVRSHTLHFRYDFSLACSPKHWPLLCC